MIDIIIPTCDTIDKVSDLVQSILDYSNEDVNIILVVNGSKHNEDAWLSYAAHKKRLNVLWFENKLGFARAVNEGLNAIDQFECDVIILNDDVLLLPQDKNAWIDTFHLALRVNKNAGILSPMIDTVNINGNTIPYSLFWCVYLTRDVINSVGSLDESLWSYYEDMDYCIRAKLEGFEVVQVCPSNTFRDGKLIGGFPIFHEGGRTHKSIPDINEHIKNNYHKVIDKYKYSFPIFNIDISKALECGGYMTPEELFALGEIASRTKGYFVELGSWMGRSSRAIADNLPEDSTLICIDTWNGTENEGDAHSIAKENEGDKVFQIFLMNNFDHVASGKIIPMRMNGRNAFDLLAQQGIKASTIFIDADHSYEAVLQDINQSFKIANDETIICGHDYSDSWQGVKKAVNESFRDFSVFAYTTIWQASFINKKSI